MKFRTKKKDIMANYPYVIRTGYCSVQHLLWYRQPIAYTSGRDGWNADIYEVNPTTVVVTGYGPFGNIEPDYKMVVQYDDDAAKYISEHKWGAEVSEHLDMLLKEMISKIVSKYKGYELN